MWVAFEIGPVHIPYNGMVMYTYVHVLLLQDGISLLVYTVCSQETILFHKFV